MPDRIASEEIVRLAVEACPSGMIMTDPDGKIVLVNAEAERLFGYGREELLDQSIDMLVPAAGRGLHGGRRASFVARPEARRMGVGRDLFGMRKDGSQIPVEIGLNPIQTRDGLMILSAITERKLADERPPLTCYEYRFWTLRPTRSAVATTLISSISLRPDAPPTGCSAGTALGRST
jgi:PAS domain S-box-containing protein